MNPDLHINMDIPKTQVFLYSFSFTTPPLLRLYELHEHCIALFSLGTSAHQRLSSSAFPPHSSSKGFNAICMARSRTARSPSCSTRRIISSSIQERGMNCQR